MRIKHRNKLAFLLGILTVILIALIAFFISYLTSFNPKRKTYSRELRNSLPDNIGGIGYLKDGNMYTVLSDGTQILNAENIYTQGDDSPLYTVDYGIDKISGKTVYLSADNKLYLSENGSQTLIASNVASWRTFSGMSAISFTVANNSDSDTGTLFLYKDGIITLLDTDINVSTVRFSQSGNYLFAQKENVYPKAAYRLIRYDLNGNSETVAETSMPVMWISDNGETVICGASADDSLYTYVIYGKNFKKQISVKNVYYPAVSDDKSVLYLLCDYNTDSRSGTLKAFDLNSLKEKTLAENVSFFTADALTDNSAGVVYSVLTDSDNGLYSVYFCNIKGKSYRLIKNTDEDAIYKVALNSDTGDGYILAPGTTRADTALYYIKLKNNDIESTRITSGYLDSLVYYEKTQTVSFIKNPSNEGSELYVAYKGETVLITENCASVYNGSSMDYTSNAVMSNDGESVLFFSNVTVSDDGLEYYGTLNLKSENSEKIIAENIYASYLLSPVANGTFTQVYYCKQTESGKYDICFFNGEQSFILAEETDGMFAIS